MANYDEQILGARQQAETSRKLREGFKMPEGQMVSGWYVRPSAGDGLVEALKLYAGYKGEKDANEKIANLTKERTEKTNKWMQDMPAPRTVQATSPVFQPSEQTLAANLLRGDQQPQPAMGQQELATMLRGNGAQEANMPPAPVQTGEMVNPNMPGQTINPTDADYEKWIMAGSDLDPARTQLALAMMKRREDASLKRDLAGQQMQDRQESRESRAQIAEANRLQQLQIAQGNQGMRNDMQQLKMQQLQEKSDALTATKQQKVDKGTETVRQTLEQMSDVYAHPGLGSGTGWTTLSSYIPATDAKDFRGQLETLQAKTFLSGVEAMKGLGALTETEGAKVTKAIGSLDPAVGEVAFRKNMQKIARDVVSMAKANGYNVPMPEWAKPAEGAASKQDGGASASFSHPDDIQAILNKQR